MLQKVHEPLQLSDRVQHHLDMIYHANPLDADLTGLAEELLTVMRLAPETPLAPVHVNLWDQRDTLVITYGDSILHPDEKPLTTLKQFLDRHSEGLLTGVHILPYYPWSSDDGFAVLDYSSVNEALGDWSLVRAIAAD